MTPRELDVLGLLLRTTMGVVFILCFTAWGSDGPQSGH